MISALLAPIGFVLQDVVADAMTVEADPTCDKNEENRFDFYRTMEISLGKYLGSKVESRAA